MASVVKKRLPVNTLYSGNQDKKIYSHIGPKIQSLHKQRSKKNKENVKRDRSEENIKSVKSSHDEYLKRKENMKIIRKQKS